MLFRDLNPSQRFRFTDLSERPMVYEYRGSGWFGSVQGYDGGPWHRSGNPEVEPIPQAVAGVRFEDQSDEFRLAVRGIIATHNGSVETYSNGKVVVALPVDPVDRRRIRVDLESIGLKEGEWWKFPLGTDKPGPHLEHKPGFWLFTSYCPIGLSL